MLFKKKKKKSEATYEEAMARFNLQAEAVEDLTKFLMRRNDDTFNKLKTSIGLPAEEL